MANTEEGGDDVKSAWSSDALGDTRATMARTESISKPARGSESLNLVSVRIGVCNSTP